MSIQRLVEASSPEILVNRMRPRGNTRMLQVQRSRPKIATIEGEICGRQEHASSLLTDERDQSGIIAQSHRSRVDIEIKQLGSESSVQNTG